MPIIWQTITDEYNIPVNFESLNAWGPDVAASMRAQIVAVGVEGDQLYYQTRSGQDLGPFQLPAGAGGSDAGVASYLTAPGSQTRAALDTIDAQRLRYPARPRASVTYGMYGGNLYTTLRIKGGLRPGVLSKTLGNRFEDTNNSGTALKPPTETILSAQARTGYAIVANDSAWPVDGANIGELIGAQIINGVARHDFSPPSTVNGGQESIGFRADGSYGLYSQYDGHTVADMVADGVINSFGYGPICISNGTPRSLAAAHWDWWRGRPSARQILGTTAGGDLLLITINGITAVRGADGVACGLLAAQEGAKDAIILDGGGSAQTRVGSGFSMPSSDPGCQRPVRSFLCIDAQPATPSPKSPWVTLPPASGTVARGGDLMYRINADAFEFKGGAQLAAGGVLPAGATVAATLPFEPPAEMLALCPANGSQVSKALVTPAGVINMYGDGGATYTRFEPLRGSFVNEVVV